MNTGLLDYVHMRALRMRHTPPSSNVTKDRVWPLTARHVTTQAGARCAGCTRQPALEAKTPLPWQCFTGGCCLLKLNDSLSTGGAPGMSRWNTTGTNKAAAEHQNTACKQAPWQVGWILYQLWVQWRQQEEKCVSANRHTT